jgi:hypothetical protein
MGTFPIFESMWHFRKLRTLYKTLTPDVRQEVLAGKMELEDQKQKDSYSDVNCCPLKRISGNRYGADEKRYKTKEIPVKPIFYRMFGFKREMSA